MALTLSISTARFAVILVLRAKVMEFHVLHVRAIRIEHLTIIVVDAITDTSIKGWLYARYVSIPV